jgi:hypothetical protein
VALSVEEEMGIWRKQEVFEVVRIQGGVLPR